MRELGSEGPAAWTAEWESRGEVVLSQRRRTLWWRLGLYFFLVVSSTLQLVDNLQEEDEVMFIKVLSALMVPFCCLMLGYTIWQLATGRPYFRIDRVGIHYGRSDRTRITWDRVATVSDPIGRWAFAHVNVRPHDGKPGRLAINHWYVTDLDAFAVWLRARRDEHCALRTPAD